MKSRMGFVAVFMVLCAASAHVDFFSLVKIGSPQDVQAAIDEGADVNAMSDYGMTALGLAAQYNQNPEVFTVLIRAGADIEALNAYDGKTALMCAAERNSNPEVIAALLQAGADANARSKEGEPPHKPGWTALMCAASQCANPEVITVLLKGGADASIKGFDGKRALDLARNTYFLRRSKALKQLEEASATE
jgi:ankyrin repeat protein